VPSRLERTTVERGEPCFLIGASEVRFRDEHAKESWRPTSSELWLIVHFRLALMAKFLIYSRAPIDPLSSVRVAAAEVGNGVREESLTSL
jgi:hypothetical protein